MGLDDGAPVPIEERTVRLESSGVLELAYDDAHARAHGRAVLVPLGVVVGLGLGSVMTYFAASTDGSAATVFVVSGGALITLGVALVAAGVGLLASRDAARARLVLAELAAG